MITAYENVNTLDWHNALSEVSSESRDVYFTPEYHSLHVANGDGTASCTLIRDNDHLLLIPGLRIAIPTALSRDPSGEYCDLQSCNGYGGPIATSKVDEQFLDRAWTAWRNVSARAGLVAGFFRLHPLLENERWLPRDACIAFDRETAFVDLTQGIDVVWTRTDSRHRNMVNKGRREGVVVQWNDSSGWPEFVQLYSMAMERVQAPASLRFSLAYFEKLRRLPGAELACVHRQGQLMAASAFLFGPRYAHYHLSARHPDAGNSLSNCILQAALERAAERGLRGLHLGGGRTRAGDDSLLRFKLSLGGTRLNFKVALVVCDATAYSNLCELWHSETGENPIWMLGYRQPRQ